MCINMDYYTGVVSLVVCRELARQKGSLTHHPWLSRLGQSMSFSCLCMRDVIISLPVCCVGLVWSGGWGVCPLIGEGLCFV